MKLWVDDIRPNPPGWVWAKTSAEALEMLKNNHIEAVSLDHDLGEDDTTRPLVLWMAEYASWPETVLVHSANPVGREWLEGMINRYGYGVTSWTNF